MINAVIEFGKQRMREMGYRDWKWEPIREKHDGVASFSLSASNEYYYLISKAVPATLVIISDTDIMTLEDSQAYGNFNFYGQKEFSGKIAITQGVNDIDLEFIRFIPRGKSKRKIKKQ